MQPQSGSRRDLNRLSIPELPAPAASAPPEPEPMNLVFACSGCADTGALADSIARNLMARKVARMSCLAGIGGRVKSIMNNARQAHRLLVIDGCSIECARRTMREAGFFNFQHLNLQELGFQKGASPVTAQRVKAGVKAAEMLLGS